MNEYYDKPVSHYHQHQYVVISLDLFTESFGVQSTSIMKKKVIFTPYFEGFSQKQKLHNKNNVGKSQMPFVYGQLRVGTSMFISYYMNNNKKIILLYNILYITLTTHEDLQSN